MAKLVNIQEYEDIDVTSFLRYLKDRIEFIADIVTTKPLVTFPTKLSKDVVDRFFSQYTVTKGEWPYYLIKYISGSSEITFDVAYPEKRNILLKFNGEECHVALPNDILGAQAFYVILENIIRNAVKHSTIPLDEFNDANGNPYRKKLLKLTISKDTDFEDNDYHKIIIKDNLGKCNKDDREKQTYGKKKNQSFINWMNGKIDRDILDDKCALRENDWGLLEIKICAAYLRKHPLEALDKKPTERLVNIVLDKDKNLCFELYLLKPKLACIITKEKMKDVNKEKWEEIGVHFVTEADLDKKLDQDKKADLGKNLMHLIRYGELILNDGSKHKVSHDYLIIEDEVLGDNEVESNQQNLKLSLSAIKDLCNFDNIESDNIELGILQKLPSSNSQTNIVMLSQNETINEEQNQPDKIVFHDHGDWPTELENKTLYFENYGAESGTAKMISDLKSNDKNNRLIEYQLASAAQLKIGILDERIQAEICDSDSDINIIQISKMMNIFVPDESDINLNKNSFHEDGDSVATKVKEWVKKNKNIFDYIVIHQGIIEKSIRSTEVEEITKFVSEFNKKAKLIIISGRGKPSNLPKDIFYLPFSLVNQYVITYRSKIYLSKLLQSARRYND
ncbi:MAG: hypothetical protein HRU40_07060 [Saprospiraceae bacterium]|nr:hypothetical protein [Saprospiraceae bacterium]